MNLVNRDKTVIGGLLYEAVWLKKVNPPKFMNRAVVPSKK